MVLSRILSLLEIGSTDRICVLDDNTLTDGNIAFSIQNFASLYLPIVSVNLCPKPKEYPRVFQVKTDSFSYAKSNPKAFTKILIKEDIDPRVVPTVIEMLIPNKESRLLLITQTPDSYVDIIHKSDFKAEVFPFQDFIFILVFHFG